MRRPTTIRQAVADAWGSMSAAEVARSFGISGERVRQPRKAVQTYDDRVTASEANERLPVEQRRIALLPLSYHALSALKCVDSRQ